MQVEDQLPGVIAETRDELDHKAQVRNQAPLVMAEEDASLQLRMPTSLWVGWQRAHFWAADGH